MGKEKEKASLYFVCSRFPLSILSIAIASPSSFPKGTATYGMRASFLQKAALIGVPCRTL